MSTCIILVDRIKSHLKKRGITYAQLAKAVAVSESTLKRWFSSKNLSLKQLDQVCIAAGITLEELTRTPLEENLQKYFTEYQENLMSLKEEYLVVFYLVAFGKSFDEILKEYKFSPVKLRQALSKLESVGLVDVHIKNRLIPKVGLGTMWIPKGKLSQKYFYLIRDEFMNSYFVEDSESQLFLSGRLSNESSKLIQKKLDKVSQEFRELYLLDANDKNANNISLFIGMRPWSFSIINNYKK